MNAARAGTLIGPWVVERLAHPDGSLRNPLTDTRIDIHFHDDDSVTGKAGCNSFRGSYRADGESIVIHTPASTRKFCLRPRGVMEQESHFFEAIVAADRFSIDERGLLTLAGVTGHSLALLKRPGADVDPDGSQN